MKFSTSETIKAFVALGIIVLLSFGLSFTAKADNVDEIDRLDTPEYCGFIAALFTRGIESRNDGRPLLFKQPTPETIGKTDAIYIVHLDELSERDRAFAIEHVSNGWNFADRLFKEATAEGFPQTNVDPELAQRYNTACLKTRMGHSYQRTDGLIHTQSRFLDPKEAKHDQCNRYRELADTFSIIAKSGAMKEEKFWIEFPEGMPETEANRIRAIAAGAFAWTGSTAEYSKGLFDACMDE